MIVSGGKRTNNFCVIAVLLHKVRSKKLLITVNELEIIIFINVLLENVKENCFLINMETQFYKETKLC